MTLRTILPNLLPDILTLYYMQQSDLRSWVIREAQGRPAIQRTAKAAYLVIW